MPVGSVAEYLSTLNVEPRRFGSISEPVALKLGVESDAPVVYVVEGRGGPCVAHLIYSREALLRALGAGSEGEAYRKLISASSTPRGLTESRFSEYFSEAGDLSSIPVHRIYAEDGGPYMTSSVFIACVGGVCNASIHRVMVVSGREGRVRVVPRHLYALMRRGGEPLPVAVAVGQHPLVLLAAATSPPLGVFELEVASSLLGGLEACRTPKYGLPVPCGASYVIEGRLGVARAPEGPFVDILGTLDPVREEPVLAVDAVYVNRSVGEPLYHTVVQASVEHILLMGFPREAAIYEAVSRVVPRVHAVRLTIGGSGWLGAVVAIEKQREGDAKNAGLAALAAHPSLKYVVVVDPDIDVDNPVAVEWAVATRVRASRDVVVVQSARGSSLDPSAEGGLTDKVIVDATIPLGEDASRFRRVAPWPRSGR